MPSYRSGPHSKYDLKLHLVWIPKYRKPVLVGPVALRVRDLLREIAMERELTIISGKVACDHLHLLIAHRPRQSVSQIVQWLKGISSRMLLEEFLHLRKQFWGRHPWAWGYFAVTSGTIADAMVREYIAEQEGEPSKTTVDFESTNLRSYRLPGVVVHSPSAHTSEHLIALGGGPIAIRQPARLGASFDVYPSSPSPSTITCTLLSFASWAMAEVR